MIYVWDNGMDYSDHQMHFVQIPADKVAEAEALAKEVATGGTTEYSSGFIAVMQLIEWRHGEPESYEDWAAGRRRTLESRERIARLKTEGKWPPRWDSSVPGHPKHKSYLDP